MGAGRQGLVQVPPGFFLTIVVFIRIGTPSTQPPRGRPQSSLAFGPSNSLAQNAIAWLTQLPKRESMSSTGSPLRKVTSTPGPTP